jgi:hypothetical protein
MCIIGQIASPHMGLYSELLVFVSAHFLLPNRGLQALGLVLALLKSTCESWQQSSVAMCHSGHQTPNERCIQAIQAKECGR